MADKKATAGLGPIVSSEHLSHQARELSEFEFGLIISSHAFNRWIVRCMTAAGYSELSPLDVLVVHSVNHRQRPKKLADICLVLNVEDSHTVSYGLKKLMRLGLVTSEKQGKETLFHTTEKGQQACRTYAEIREACLVDSLSTLGISPEEMHRLAGAMRALSGVYDQASRAAAVF